MLKKPRKTRDFRAWLHERLSTLLPTSRKETARYADLIDKMYLLDFDPAMDLIVSRHSTTGRPAADPSAMLRALLLVADQHNQARLALEIIRGARRSFRLGP